MYIFVCYHQVLSFHTNRITIWPNIKNYPHHHYINRNCPSSEESSRSLTAVDPKLTLFWITVMSKWWFRSHKWTQVLHMVRDSINLYYELLTWDMWPMKDCSYERLNELPCDPKWFCTCCACRCPIRKNLPDFGNPNLYEKMSHVSESRVTYVKFSSRKTCINGGFMKEKRIFFSWLDALKMDGRLGETERKRKRRRKGKVKIDLLVSIGLDFFLRLQEKARENLLRITSRPNTKNQHHHHHYIHRNCPSISMM